MCRALTNQKVTSNDNRRLKKESRRQIRFLERYILLADDFGSRRISRHARWPAVAGNFGLGASEGQLYRCPMSHPTPVTNQAIQPSRSRGIFMLPRSHLLSIPEPPMPKNKVSDPITDQEIAFARLVLSGRHDRTVVPPKLSPQPRLRRYTKSKPRVRA